MGKSSHLAWCASGDRVGLWRERSAVRCHLFFAPVVFPAFSCTTVTYRKGRGPMRVPSHPTLIRRMLDARVKQVAAHGPLLTASLATVHKRCGQPSCSCHQGGPAHPAAHLT